VASVVKEEPLNLTEVMGMLDETIAYSRQLEQKSQELEAATTELRAANEQLKELDRLKDDFISTVSHELRTPLTSIRAFSEILYDNPTLDEIRQSQFLNIILKESERLTRLINQVLDLSKIESGQMAWNLADVNLKELITEALTTTGQLFEEKNIQVELDLPESVPLIVTDRDRIMQVLLNLLSNAMKFCNSEAGWVGIRLQLKKDMVQVDVSDNGPGIPPKDQQVIFEKFRQVGDALTDKPQGTGLGLPICQRIITYFGGKLWVKCEPGHGATFSFTLPIQPQPVGSEMVTNGRSRLLMTIKSLRGLTSK
jgi:signal transduction histidine kinase